MNPEQGRRFVRDIRDGMTNSAIYYNEIYETNSPIRAHFGKDNAGLINGMVAGLNHHTESGDKIDELIDRYSGTFVEGVKLGARLSVYEGREFTFTEKESTESKFTFTER